MQPDASGDIETATAEQALTNVKVPQSVAAGAYHSLFLKKDGTVWTWGQNVTGQLGTGGTSSTPQSQPGRVYGLPSIKAVAAGIGHSIALDVSGNVWAWGQNASGQAGLGTAGSPVLVPTKVAALSGIQAIAANGNFSLALGVDGRLWGWGLNSSAQVGTGSTSSAVLAPVQVAGLPIAKAVAAGAGHSLIVDEQFGNVWAWGQNTFGQVGTGSTSSAPVVTPVPVNGVFAVTKLIAGHNSSLAIIGNGLAVAWGHNASGQLGNGGTANSASPVGVTGISDATALAAGAQHTLALRPGCPVWVWGNNGQGQLGTGSTSTTPVTVPGTALVANTFYFDGDMDGFGDEYIAEEACEPSPGYVEDLDCDDYSATSHPGAEETCNGMDDDCDGVVDNGSASGGAECSTGQQGVCAAGVTACTNGTVVCQQRQAASTEQCDGLDNDCDGTTDEGNPGGLQACPTGQLGVCGEGVTYCTQGAIHCVPTHGATSEVCDGKDNDCDGQVDDGLLFQAWYRDQDGDSYGLTSQAAVQACLQPTGYVSNVGDCDDANASIHPGAAEVCDGVDNDCDGQVDEGASCVASAVQLAAGGDHTLALKQDGTVWAWGFNGWGSLGDGTTTDRRTAGQVPGLTGVASVAAGNSHSLALKQDGTVWAWGYNDLDQFDDGIPTNRLTPAQVPGLTGVASVAAGDYHMLALKQDGTVWAWGYNFYGQLGDGTTTNRLTPVQIPSLTGVMALAAGGLSSIALKQDGTVWAWGYNSWGNLGDGTTTTRLTPGRVPGLTGVASVAANRKHSLALKQDGTVWAWGGNHFGQLGDGTTTDRLTPVQAQGLMGVKALAVGDHHTLALKQDGTVWAWGWNNRGQLGDGTTTQRLTPVQVQGFTGVAALADGSSHSLALKQDGTVWAWGENIHGQLGDGTTTRRLTPVQVQGLNL